MPVHVNKLLLCVLSLTFLLVSCGDEVDAPVLVNPSAVTLLVGATQQFSLTGGSNNAVWRVNGVEGGNATLGTITNTGLYTAPGVPPSPNTVTVTADGAVLGSEVTIENPAPALTSSAPATATSGSPDQILTLGGSGFASQSVVSAGGSDLDTTFVSNTELTAVLPAALVTTAGVVDLGVNNPAPGGGTTATLPFTVLDTGVVTTTNNPQVANYTMSLPREGTMRVEFGVPGNQDLTTWTRSAPAGGGEVSIYVAGMRPFTTYNMRAIVEFADGIPHVDADHDFTTGGLPPERTPTITVTRSDTQTPTPGVQMWDLIGDGGTGKVRAVVTDLDGEVIWFYDDLLAFPFPIQFLPNGNFLMNDRNIRLIEVDLGGNVVKEIGKAEIEVKLAEAGFEPVAAGIHHALIALPNGHWIVMGSFTKPFTDLVGFEGTQVDVLGDSLIELDENLDPVWVWSSFDHLDVNRHPFSDPAPPSGFDWTHGNAVAYSAADGNLLVSLRHQHWVLKIDYQDGLGTGNVIWRLGFEGDFDLTNAGPEGYQYAQHFPFFVDETLSVFDLAVWDNGNLRVVDEATGATCDPSEPPPPIAGQQQLVAPEIIDVSPDVMAQLWPERQAPPQKGVVQAGTRCFSRAVIFELDEGLNTARIVWEEDVGFFSPFIGSVQVLGNGNVVWDAGTVEGSANGVVRESLQVTPPEMVWQADVSGQLTYRSLRLPSLYPGVQW